MSGPPLVVERCWAYVLLEGFHFEKSLISLIFRRPPLKPSTPEEQASISLVVDTLRNYLHVIYVKSFDIYEATNLHIEFL